MQPIGFSWPGFIKQNHAHINVGSRKHKIIHRTGKPVKPWDFNDKAALNYIQHEHDYGHGNQEIHKKAVCWRTAILSGKQYQGR